MGGLYTTKDRLKLYSANKCGYERGFFMHIVCNLQDQPSRAYVDCVYKLHWAKKPATHVEKIASNALNKTILCIIILVINLSALIVMRQ